MNGGDVARGARPSRRARGVRLFAACACAAIIGCGDDDPSKPLSAKETRFVTSVENDINDYCVASGGVTSDANRPEVKLPDRLEDNLDDFLDLVRERPDVKHHRKIGADRTLRELLDERAFVIHKDYCAEDLYVRFRKVLKSLPPPPR